MRICLIGAAHPCHNPRLVREADALVDAGHDVRVVAPWHSEHLAAKDGRLIAKRQWRFQPVDFRPMGARGRVRSFMIRGRRRAVSMLRPHLSGRPLAELAYTLALPELEHKAAAEPADWFIAHTQAALPVAVWAARRWNARIGFDCEDLLSEGARDPVDIVKIIETKYLPQCSYVSIPSEAMACKLQAAYRIPKPIVLYNVFPLYLAGGMTPPVKRLSRQNVRLHWFSQTIGPDRGIEDAVRAMTWLPGTVELHLRGRIYDEYRAQLQALASSCGAGRRVFFHPQVDHDELIRTMESFDIGLALERPDDPNYNFTVTNKVFSYFLAGLPVIATQTVGHSEVLSSNPSISVTYPAGDARRFADSVRTWVNDPAALQSNQQAAWDIARERFCWDHEQHSFLEIFAGRSAAPADRALPVCAES